MVSTADIAVYTAIPGAGTRTAWDAFLGGDSSTCIPAGEKTTHQTVETFNPGILANGDAKRAISLASFGTWNGKIKPYPDGSKLGKVDNVAPTKATLVNGSFPFGRFIYNVYCTAACTNGGAASQATLDYVGEDGWLCKNSTEHSTEPFSGKNYRTLIAQTITQGGFVPLPLGSTGGGAAARATADCSLTDPNPTRPRGYHIAVVDRRTGGPAFAPDLLLVAPGHRPRPDLWRCCDCDLRSVDMHPKPLLPSRYHELTR